MRTVPYRLPVCVPVRSSMPGLLLGLVCCFLLSACFSVRLPEGVIATVNGEPIHLRTVQALLDSRSGALGMQRRPTLANLKNLYGEGLGTLVVQALIRQRSWRPQLIPSVRNTGRRSFRPTLPSFRWMRDCGGN